jgi:hypothetical protein
MTKTFDDFKMDDVVDEATAAELVKLWTEKQLRNLRHRREGPVFSKIGKIVAYRVGDVKEWLDKAMRSHKDRGKDPARVEAGKKISKAKAKAKPAKIKTKAKEQHEPAEDELVVSSWE